MDIRALIRNVVARVCVTLVCMAAFSSCSDSWLYEDEGDCSVYYRVKFCYDMNLKWADAFANEVTSVHLYAFDRSGVLVWQKEEKIEESMAKDYSMLLDLPAGDYRLLAWCGLKNDGEHEESFSVPETTPGVTRIEQLQCSLTRQRDESGAYSDTRLYRLYHGTLDVTLPSDDDGGIYDYTIYLTKNTNHIRVMLHHLSGEDVDVNQFTFCIDDENGVMGSDNELVDDENINYRPWKLQNGVAGLDRDEEPSRAVISSKGAIADLTVGRMCEPRREKMMLTINNTAGEKVARIPVIDYALLAKEYYEEEYGHKMTDQEFLDREDEYVLTLFLDENNKWISSQILIHSWCIVLQDVEIK